jgi:hypothetical protein
MFLEKSGCLVSLKFFFYSHQPCDRIAVSECGMHVITSNYFSAHYSNGKGEEEVYVPCAETPFRMLSRFIDPEASHTFFLYS